MYSFADDIIYSFSLWDSRRQKELEILQRVLEMNLFLRVASATYHKSDDFKQQKFILMVLETRSRHSGSQCDLLNSGKSSGNLL